MYEIDALIAMIDALIAMIECVGGSVALVP